MNYKLITSPTAAHELTARLQSEKFIALDTETTGLDPHQDQVILLSVSTQKETFLFDTRKTGLEVFRDLLQNEAISKIGFNLNFDYRMLKGNGAGDTENCRDLMLAEYCLMAGIQLSGYSLEAVTKKYLGKERDKSLQKSFIGHQGDFSAAQLLYAAEDTSDLIPLAETMQRELISTGTAPAWGIENRSLPAWADIQFYGQKLDTLAWKGIMEENAEKIKKAKQNLDGYFAPFFDRDLFGELDINYNSQPTILYGLQKMGIKVDGSLIKNTSKETQKKIRDLNVTKALEAYRQAVKAYGTYGQSYLDAIHPVTGRIHPRFNQYGTDTARPSCRGGINVLNIPRDKTMRAAFVTDPDRSISTVDFSGAELRILADQSKDPLMIEGFNSGTDFHCFVASMLFKKEVTKKNENAKLRQPAKTINFGLAYGMGPGRLYTSLKGEGYDTTEEECRKLFDTYKRTFKTAVRWLDSNKQKAREELSMSNLIGRRRRWHAPDQDKVTQEIEAELLKRSGSNDLTETQESLLLRLVHERLQATYSGIEREGANFMVQSTNVEWTKDAMAEIRKQCKKRGYDARMYNSVYDEIVLDVADKDAESVHQLQCKIMIESGQKFCSSVPVEVEGHLAKHWTK